MMPRLARRACLVMPALLLARCAPKPPPPPPPPPSVELTIKGGADQNPGPGGQPTPVAVQLYLLTAGGRFAMADAYALMDRAAAVLGEDASATETAMVRPGETKTLTLAPKPGVRMLGIAVMFRDIDRATWRAQAPIAPHGPTRLVLTINRLKANLEPA